MTIKEQDMQTLGGFLNFSLKPIDAPVLQQEDLHIDTHPEIHTYSHPMHTMALTQAHLCLRLLQVQKCECENEQARKEGSQDEVRYSFSRRGVRTTRSWGESAHCPCAPHTYAHVRQRAAASAAQPNMLQHLPKKSENECKLRLFYPPRCLCLTLVIKSLSAATVGGAQRLSVGGRCLQYLPLKKWITVKKKYRTLLLFPFLFASQILCKQQGVTCQSYRNPWHHTSK